MTTNGAHPEGEGLDIQQEIAAIGALDELGESANGFSSFLGQKEDFFSFKGAMISPGDNLLQAMARTRVEMADVTEIPIILARYRSMWTGYVDLERMLHEELTLRNSLNGLARWELVMMHVGILTSALHESWRNGMGKLGKMNPFKGKAKTEAAA